MLSDSDLHLVLRKNYKDQLEVLIGGMQKYNFTEYLLIIIRLLVHFPYKEGQYL